VHLARRYSIDDKLLPLYAALLFSIHPINTESINWISGRTDLLAGIFILVAVYLLLIALHKENCLWALAAALAFLIGCFAKEVAVCALPGFLFLVISYDSHGSILQRLRKRWVCSAFLSAPVITYFLFRHLAFNRGDSGMQTVTNAVNAPTFDFIDTLRVILKVFGFYVKKIFLPWPLNFTIIRISDYYVIVGVMLIFAVAYMFYKRSLITALLLTSICVTAPALLVALARMAWTPLAERYLYIPCATFSIAISLFVYNYLSNKGSFFRKSSCTLIALLFTFSAYSTVKRNIIWQSNISLFQDALRNSPGFFPAQNSLAHALQLAGRDAESRELILSMVAPEGSKRGGEFVDSNRARIMVDDGNLLGAKKLLLRNLDDSGSFFATLAEQIIVIDMKLLREEKNVLKSRELRREILGLLQKMQEKSGDPLYYYRMGQFQLHMEDKKAAQQSFSEAYLRSPEGAYYKQAAKKLAENLKQ